ncbi:MAG: hypothetical protein KDD40_05825 [Bdellovibrionales bacterium]|nr:hypothetical protein [Bdellovibrionales bacterium]
MKNLIFHFQKLFFLIWVFTISISVAYGDALDYQHQYDSNSPGAIGEGLKKIKNIGSGVKDSIGRGVDKVGSAFQSDPTGAAGNVPTSSGGSCDTAPARVAQYFQDGKEIINHCHKAIEACNGSESVFADIYALAAQQGSEMAAVETTKDSVTNSRLGELLHNGSATTCATSGKQCEYNNQLFQSQLGGIVSESENHWAAQQNKVLQSTCGVTIKNFAKQIAAEAGKNTTYLALKTNENYRGLLANMQAKDQSLYTLKSLKSEDNPGGSSWWKDNAAGLAIGGSVGAAALLLLNQKSDDKSDKNSNGDGSGEGNESNNGFSVSKNPDGGQCIKYGKNQEKCYDNDQLSRLCLGTANTSTIYPYPAIQENAQTNKMKEALCTAFNKDESKGGGADPNACYTFKAEYYKDKGCEKRMLTQCQNSDFADCANFNQYFCYGESGAGKGSNYCVYREAKDYCENSGASTSSPSCAWMRQMATVGARGSNSCNVNIQQTDCYPDAFNSQAEMQNVCARMAINDKDPLCKNINSAKMYFSWRHPGNSGNSVALVNYTNSGSTPNTSSTTANINNGSVSSCVQPTVDCALPANRSTAQCISYYCCQPNNSAAPICQSLAFATVSSNHSGFQTSSVSRYPANSLPSDISPVRAKSIISSTSHSMGESLCKSGQLYDCGTLRGYIPRAQ